MNKKFLLNKVGGFALAVLVLGGVVVLSTTEADAQRRYYRSYRPNVYRVYRPYYPLGWNRFGWGWNDYDPYFRYNQYVFDNPERAAQTAYNQGVKTGRDDGKKSKSYSPERSHYYREAGFGNFGEVYRRNFSRGYQTGYRGGQEEAGD